MLTAHEDRTTDAVISELNQRGASIARIDTGDFPIRSQLAATISATGVEGRLRAPDVEVGLSSVQSVYYRRPTRFRFSEGLSDADTLLAATEARLGFGGVLAALDVLWLNHPAQVAIAEYKPVQLRIATQCGMRIPRTLVTNDKSSAIQFAEAVGGTVICKMLSSLVLSENGVPHMTYTTPIDVGAIDPSAFATTTHLIQEWVPKKYEARVTMVDKRAFAVAIHAGSERSHIDWRSDYESLTYQKIDPPGEVVTAIAQFLRRLGLAFGAFDFVVTPNDEWVMLECNPAGQWLWLQEEVGVQIAAGIADLLVSGGLDD
ncbi:MAG: ATP-grasp ribosomal peptide maturase [Pseudonocardiaceae bacterium]